MFRNVIVGVDGGEGGRDAIALARLLLDEQGQMTLTHVYRGEPALWGSSAPLEAAERDQAQELLEAARTSARIDAPLRLWRSPSVGRGLHELAEAIDSDLLVIGSSRRALVGRVLVGDDTRAALNGAACAVAIAPVGQATRPPVMREIGVGYDGSPESRHALGIAKELAQAFGIKLSALQAVSLPAYDLMACGIPEANWIEDEVDAARERIAALDGVEPHAGYGVAAEELALFSASLDLLVVGSRGYGPIGRLVHGSTSEQLARTARCSLLVLPRAARMGDAKKTNGEITETAAAAPSA